MKSKVTTQFQKKSFLRKFRLFQFRTHLTRKLTVFYELLFIIFKSENSPKLLRKKGKVKEKLSFYYFCCRSELIRAVGHSHHRKFNDGHRFVITDFAHVHFDHRVIGSQRETYYWSSFVTVLRPQMIVFPLSNKRTLLEFENGMHLNLNSRYYGNKMI